MRSHLLLAFVMTTFVICLPWSATAQSIAGSVADETGGVLPGVTVEVRSPALIEGIRSTITDGSGLYEIEALRPGVYTVTFTLPGFSTFVREGIELTSGFTASVDAQMSVGSIEETVTVTGASPEVDTVNVRQQEVVSDDTLRALPTSSRAASTFVALIPGLSGVADVGGAGGLLNQNSVWRGWYHGKSGINHLLEGISFETQLNSVSFIANPYNVEEVQVETGGVSADSDSQGVVINMIPKEGGNTFTGYAYGFWGNDSLQADNITDELRDRGYRTSNEAIYVYDTSVSVGGPIKRNKLWFYATGRGSDAKINVPNVFFNATQGTPVYTPDPDRPAFRREWLKSGAVRMTWQVSERNKVTSYVETQSFAKRGTGNNASPEASSAWLFWPEGIYTANWTAPVSNRLLLEASGAYTHNPYPYPSPGDSFMQVSPNDISITEGSTGFAYNAKRTYSFVLDTRYVQRFSVSYVTGSHSFKTGFDLEQGAGRNEIDAHGDVNYTFFQGRPISITEWATPYSLNDKLNAEFAFYAQDQWTIDRLTLNYGLRFDSWRASIPAQDLPATQFVAARSYAEVNDVPNFKDFNPRLGVAYDLFGDGRTALKASLSRYVYKASKRFTGRLNPVSTSVNTVSRTWNDTNGDFIPGCSLTNPAANGECGQISNQNFGQPNPRTRYADDVLTGIGNRNSLWDFALELEHQLRPGLSLSAGYFRNWASNFEATDNLAVTPADFDPFCVTAPVDPRLPNGGGYEVCGLYDVVPAKFGLSDNVVSQAENFYADNSSVTCGSSPSSFTAGMIARNFGEMCGLSDFFNVSFDARFSDFQLGGGVDTGRTVNDRCFVVDSPQEELYCRTVVPLHAQVQVKLHGSYTLPGDISVSAMFQNVGGPEIEANHRVFNAEVAPSLGRDLSACRGAAACNATVVVPLIKPLTEWEGRRTQVDVRLSKRFALGSTTFIRANLDIYNLLNASPVLGINHTYGARWLQPIAFVSQEAVLQGRFFQFSGELEF